MKRKLLVKVSGGVDLTLKMKGSKSSKVFKWNCGIPGRAKGPWEARSKCALYLFQRELSRLPCWFGYVYSTLCVTCGQLKHGIYSSKKLGKKTLSPTWIAAIECFCRAQHMLSPWSSRRTIPASRQSANSRTCAGRRRPDCFGRLNGGEEPFA